MPLSPLPLFPLLTFPRDVLGSIPSSKFLLTHSSDCSFKWVTTTGLHLFVEEPSSKRLLDLFNSIGDSVLNSSSRQSQIWLPLRTPDFSAENSILGHDTSSPGLCFSVSLLIVTAMKALFLDTSAAGNQDLLIEDILERWQVSSTLQYGYICKQLKEHLKSYFYFEEINVSASSLPCEHPVNIVEEEHPTVRVVVLLWRRWNQELHLRNSPFSGICSHNVRNGLDNSSKFKPLPPILTRGS